MTCGCHQDHRGRIRRSGIEGSSRTPLPAPSPEAIEALASADPLAFLKRCRDHYLATVTDYRCRFRKRERLNGTLGPEEEMDVLFRERPFSVRMQWLRNPRMAKRITYVAGRWVSGGRQMALVQPHGLLGLLAPAGVKTDIHGAMSRRAARRTIDDFGFHRTLDFIIEYCEKARGEPGYALRYVGRGRSSGRASYILERRLPFPTSDGRYPNRLLITHIDAEWLVPIASYAFADDDGKTLLGSYVTTNIVFNVGLTDEDF